MVSKSGPRLCQGSQREPGPEFQTSLRGYGYLWWVTPLSTHQAYTAFGRYGQLITIIPDVEAVIVVSSRISETALGLEDYIGFVDAAIAPQLH
jgi:CubicO group peptidase (beta-lactamase class C family)